MAIGDLFSKLKSSISKQMQKSQIESRRTEEIRILKESYLSRLSHQELVQIYKTYFGD